MDSWFPDSLLIRVAGDCDVGAFGAFAGRMLGMIGEAGRGFRGFGAGSGRGVVAGAIYGVRYFRSGALGAAFDVGWWGFIALGAHL